MHCRATEVVLPGNEAFLCCRKSSLEAMKVRKKDCYWSASLSLSSGDVEAMKFRRARKRLHRVMMSRFDWLCQMFLKEP